MVVRRVHDHHLRPVADAGRLERELGRGLVQVLAARDQFDVASRDTAAHLFGAFIEEPPDGLAVLDLELQRLAAAC